MGLEPDARLVLNREVDLRKLPLTPVDFFIYSRVEALSGGSAPSVADVIAASGQPSDAAQQVLQKLVELSVVTVEGDGGEGEGGEPKPRARTRSDIRLGTGSDTKERAQARRRKLLAAQLRVAGGAGKPKPKPTPEPADETRSEDDTLPTPRSDQRPADPPAALRSILEQVEPVAETDPRLERGATVEIERQRRLLALRDSLRHIGHFELLGLEPVDDTKVIRRAYHVISREFHPDSFYGKNLGGFKDVLDALFRRARSSYEILMDAEQRAPLVEAYQVKLRAEQERRTREEVARAEVEAEKDRLQREAEAKAEKEATRARIARDRERHERIRDRALAQRRRQARQHAEQAGKEQEEGRHGTAATLFRLAHEEDPNNETYEQAWRESLAIARRQRAEASFEKGRSARKAGRSHDAARLLADAADADPSLRNLAEAAGAMAEVDSVRARELAMAALETLTQAQARGAALDDHTVAGVHQSCAKAFLSAGQVASAKEQAERAHQLAPSNKTRTLLNSIKLT